MRALAQHISKPLPLTVKRSDGSSATLRITATDAVQSMAAAGIVAAKP